MPNGPWNPNHQEKRVNVETTAIAVTTSGIVTVSAPMRVVRRANPSYDGKGGSGIAAVHVIQVSGNQADVQFYVHSGDQLANSGVVTRPYVPHQVSGPSYSGGTLNVDFWGDF